MLKNTALALWSEPMIRILVVLLLCASFVFSLLGRISDVWVEAYSLLDQKMEFLEEHAWESPYREALEIKKYQIGLSEYYKEKLEDVQQKRKLPIFSTAYSTKKLALDEKHLSQLQDFPEGSFQDGFYRSMLESFHLDILWILFLFPLGYYLFLHDGHEFGVLYRSMPRAGLELYIKKWFLFVLFAFFSFIIFMLGTFFCALPLYPMESMPMQAILGMKDVYLPLSAKEFLLYTVVLRFLRGVCLASLLPLCTGIFSERKAYGLLGLLLVFSYGAYFSIPEQSSISLLKYVNVLGIYFLPKDLFFSPLAMVGGRAYEMKKVFLLLLGVYILFFPLSYKSYERASMAKKVSHKPAKERSFSYPVNLFLDSFLYRKSFVFLLFALIYWISLPLLFNPSPTPLLDHLKMDLYKEYEGEVSQEKIYHILDEKKKVEEEELRYRELTEQFYKSKVEMPSVELQFLKEGEGSRMAFLEFYHEIEFSLRAGKGIYNPQYYDVFLSFDQPRYVLKDFLLHTVLLILLLSFGVAPLIHEDEDVFRSFAFGGNYRIKWIFILGILYCGLFVIAPLLAHGIRVGKMATFTGFSMPMSSIFHEESSFHFGSFLLFRSLSVFVLYCVLLLVVMIAGRKFRSPLCFLFGFFALTIFLALHLLSSGAFDPFMMLTRAVKNPWDFLGLNVFLIGLLLLLVQIFHSTLVKK